ncbi:MAG: bifunctional diaminohydroxyphosphoribosylaminopyrimidine deaminase/5-amino-6-(5-phosphoribosylamino)uracil reductase RibD [Inquilinaceae bacterium]
MAGPSSGQAGADARWMAGALALARRGLGRVWPNPAVGCVLVNGHRIVGRGWTQPGGRPHAETEALGRAGSQAAGATAYVTLEPCAHAGKTPPCATALIKAGVSRVVVATEDPDPRVDGRGLALLRKAGIAVDVGVGASEARAINAGFFSRLERGRPLVTLKLATSLDGRIATHDGQSQWVTGPVARAWGHRLRATADAILIGMGTVLADDPLLTCRLPGLEDRSPVRVVVDSRLRVPLTARLIQTAREVPTWIITLKDGDIARREGFEASGAVLLEVEPDGEGNPDLAQALALLGDRGITRLLAEGGGRLAASLVRADLIDRLAWFRAPTLIGGDGLPAVQPFGVERLADQPRFGRQAVRSAGRDIFEQYQSVP